MKLNKLLKHCKKRFVCGADDHQHGWINPDVEVKELLDFIEEAYEAGKKEADKQKILEASNSEIF